MRGIKGIYMKKFETNLGSCLIVRRLSIICVAIMAFSAFAGGLPDDDMILAPQAKEHWAEGIMIEDDSGVMVNMRNHFQAWQRTEEYARQWDIQSTGLYEVAPREQQQAFFQRHILKYLDKRISGEAKKAEEGSTLHRVNTVSKALSPSSAVAISKGYKFKVRAKVLQRRGSLIFVNPFVDANAEYSVTEGSRINVGKSFQELGLNTNVTFNPQNQNYVATVNQNFQKVGVSANITYNQLNANYVASVSKQITNTVSTTVSSHQSENEMLLSENSNRTVSVNYATPF